MTPGRDLLRLQEEKQRLRDKTLEIYLSRDFVHAKPLV